MLSDESSYHRVQVSERYRARSLLGGIVYLGSTGSKLGEVYTYSSTIAECPSHLGCCLKNGFNVVLWRCKHIAVGECDLYTLLIQSTVGKDTPTEQELLFHNELPNLCISTAYTVKPVIE